MANFFRKILEYGKGANIDRPGLRRVVSLDSEKVPFEQIHLGTEGKMSEITEEQIKNFVRLIADEEVLSDRDIVALGNVLRAYSMRGIQDSANEGTLETVPDMSEKEKNLVSLAVVGFEKWVLEGGAAGLLDKTKNGENRSLSAAAFLANQFAKLKERYGDEIYGGDLEKTAEFLEQVRQFSEERFSEESVKKDFDDIGEKKKENFSAKNKLNEEAYVDLEAVSQSIQQLKSALQASTSVLESSGSDNLKQIASLINDLIERQIVINEILEKGVGLADALTLLSEDDPAVAESREAMSKMWERLSDEEKEKLNFLTEKYRELSENYRNANENLRKMEYSQRFNLLNTEEINLQSNEMDVRRFLDVRKVFLESVLNMIEESKGNLSKNSTEFLYLMKNIIIGIEIVRRKLNYQGNRGDLTPQVPNFPKDRYGAKIAIGVESLGPDDQSYYVVHAPLERLEFDSVLGEYFFSKSQE